MQKLKSVLSVLVGLTFLAAMGMVLVALLQNVSSGEKPAAIPSSQGYPARLATVAVSLPSVTQPAMPQGYPALPATVAPLPNVTQPAIPTLQIPVNSTETPFPTFPPPPTPTRRSGAMATPMPLLGLAKDSSGSITCIENAQDGLASLSLSVDAKGTASNAPKRLSGSTNIVGAMYPSPDGSRILIMQGAGVVNVLSVLYPNTGQIKSLFGKESYSGLFLGWHPDSRQVLVRTDGVADRGLWLINVDTGEHTALLVQLSPNIDGADASPDGQKVIYTFQVGGVTTHEEMWVVNVDGSDPHLIFSGMSLLAPLWSPDGAQIAFVGKGLMVINADGSDPRVLSPYSGFDVYLPNFAWSPDSQKIAIIAPEASVSPADSEDIRGLNIHLVDVKSGQEHPLLPLAKDTGNSDPTWSPDGSQIAFASTRSGKSEIWVVNVDGTNLRQLTNTDQPVRFPRWHRP